MRLWKLTDRSGRTQNNTLWGQDVEHQEAGSAEIDGAGWLHAFTDFWRAALVAAIYDGGDNRLWLAEGDVDHQHNGIAWCRTLRTIHEVPIPHVTPWQRVRIAVLAALETHHSDAFAKWASSWLSGADRSRTSATAAASTCLPGSDALLAARAAEAIAASGANKAIEDRYAIESATMAINFAAAGGVKLAPIVAKVLPPRTLTASEQAISRGNVHRALA